MSRIKQLKGFTLIELIVVVIIIGVLAAIGRGLQPVRRQHPHTKTPA